MTRTHGRTSAAAQCPLGLTEGGVTVRAGSTFGTVIKFPLDSIKIVNFINKHGYIYEAYHNSHNQRGKSSLYLEKSFLKRS